MPKFLKPGKVVIILNGRHAGKKAVIVKNFDEPTGGPNGRPYGHCLVAGIDRYPGKVTARMGKTKVASRSRVKPFVKVVNYAHMMPTRYGLDLDLKNVVTVEGYTADPAKRREVKKKVKKLFEDRYQAGKNKWFFTKLSF